MFLFTRQNKAPSGAYDDRLQVSRPVYSQETFDAAESARGANARDNRTATQKLTDKLSKCCHCDRKRATDFVLDLVPALRWLPKYDLKTNLIGDIMAGFTISVLHLPQVRRCVIIAFFRLFINFIKQSINQSIDRSIDLSINQSINQSINHLFI